MRWIAILLVTAALCPAADTADAASTTPAGTTATKGKTKEPAIDEAEANRLLDEVVRSMDETQKMIRDKDKDKTSLAFMRASDCFSQLQLMGVTQHNNIRYKFLYRRYLHMTNGVMKSVDPDHRDLPKDAAK